MALKAVHVSDVPNLDQVPKGPTLTLSSSRLPKGTEEVKSAFKPAKFVVIGHRGKGMNALASPDRRMKEIKENSILSFNLAGRFPVDFVEFDVQTHGGNLVFGKMYQLVAPGKLRGGFMVTKDDCPIIFHDSFILTEEDGNIYEKRVTDLTLDEFLSYGPQKESGNVGKPLLRKTKDGTVFSWNVEVDDPLCTLEEVFHKVDSHLGFNIELKFDDNVVYQEEKLTHILQLILQVVCKYANERPIIFSSFHPDAAQLIRKLQGTNPVFFLTNGGSEIYTDVRRNSLDEAIKLCLAGGLQGIVSEVKAIFRNSSLIPRIKESNLALLTYGQLNNVPEAVYMQHLMGINGVIVDLVQEITEAVSDFINPEKIGDESISDSVRKGKAKEATKPEFSQRELSFLMRLIPELVQQ